MRTQQKLVLFSAVPILVLGAIMIIVHNRDNTTIPNSVKQHANFPILYPIQKTPNLVLIRTTLAYNTTENALTYSVLISGKKIVVSEQATPSIFSESGVYAFKLNQAHVYDNFTSSAGDINLTRPDDLQHQTVAWDNTNGTFILAHALQELSTSEWKLLFNNLMIVH